jgi:hypothetical protein
VIIDPTSKEGWRFYESKPQDLLPKKRYKADTGKRLEDDVNVIKEAVLDLFPDAEFVIV